jgi:class 3 adenylate cyclase
MSQPQPRNTAAMSVASETASLFASLRQSANPDIALAIERHVEDAPDRELCRINPLAFATQHHLDEEAVIAAFLHAAHLGIFELAWNVFCPSCCGVLESAATLRSVKREQYKCAFCDTSYEPKLDEVVEVTFTVNPRVRRIAAHDPQTLPVWEYYRQVFWSSGIELPDDASLDKLMSDIVLDAVELPAGSTAILSLQVPETPVIICDPVVHASEFITVKGEATRERQNLGFILTKEQGSVSAAELRPGAVRISIENRTNQRTIPTVWIAGDALSALLSARRPYLSAKRLLTNQTFRDLFRTDTLDVDQRLKITSLTFLFTDLKGSTELYDRVGDLVAFDLVNQHFHVMNDIVAAESGAVVKTIGDALMATFPTPDRAVAAALKMRNAIHELDEDLTVKIGIHEGPCLAVVLNERQDFFGQTVNIAARVQGLADSHAILATGQVVGNAEASQLLRTNGITPLEQRLPLRGISDRVAIYALP